MSPREPFSGRMFGIFNVEGDSPEPVAMFQSRASAEAYLKANRALPVDDEEGLGDYHQIFSCDAVGVWWNSYEPDPRADSPLMPEEVMAAYAGES